MEYICADTQNLAVRRWCEKKTETAELHQHLARLSGGHRRTNWYHSTTVVYSVEDFTETRYKNSDIIRVFHSSSLRALALCSALHLSLVTFERLIAIKYTMRYPYIITNQKLKVAVIVIWVYIFSCEILRRVTTAVSFNFVISLVLI